MRLFICAFKTLTLLLLSITAHAQSNSSTSTTVPIVYFHDLITVPIFVNDTGPHFFIIDTGSTATVLYENFAQQLNIPQNGTMTQNVHGINATQIRPSLIRTNFRIGNFDLGTILPVKGPTWKGRNIPAGIIGTDLLKDYGIIVNSGDMTLTVANAEAFKSLLTPSWKSIKLKLNPYDRKTPRGLIFVDMRIDRAPRIPAIFDTGSQVTLMNEATANTYFKGHRVSNGGQSWTHRDALTTSYLNRMVRIPKLKMGRTKWDKSEVYVKSMTSLDLINKRRRPLMIVGMDLMKNRDFAINFPKKRLYISGPHDVKADNAAVYSLAFNEAHD